MSDLYLVASATDAHSCSNVPHLGARVPQTSGALAPIGGFMTTVTPALNAKPR
jgi:hypothetical protein